MYRPGHLTRRTGASADGGRRASRVALLRLFVRAGFERRNRLPGEIWKILLLVLAFSQLGCSFLFFGGRFGVDVSPLPKNINGGFPVAVDVIVVYKKSVEAQVEGMSATDWFAQRDQFLRDNPGDVVSNLHEWVPGQTVSSLRISYKMGARSAYIFAKYFSPGDHRQQLRIGQNVLLRLGADDFEVTKQ